MNTTHTETARARRLRRMGAARVIAEDIAPHSPADDVAGIVARPDGYYWQSPDGLQQFGPFANRLEALADRDRYSEQAPAEGETVQEAELEIGIADWIDVETGAPAEGLSRPHIADY